MQLPAAQRQAASLHISSYSFSHYTGDTQRHHTCQVGVASSRVVTYDASTDGKVTELGSLGALASYPTNVSALSFETQLPLPEYHNILIIRMTPVEDGVKQKIDDN